MPELPEIETLKLQLEKVLPGLIIDQVEVLSSKSWQGDLKQVHNLQVQDVSRRGKALIINLKKLKAQSSKLKTHGSQLSLVIHLKMTGQLILEGQAPLIFEPHGVGDPSPLQHRLVGGHPTADFISQLPSKHTRVIIRLKGNPTLPAPSLAKRGKSLPFTKGEVRRGFRNNYVSTLYFNDQRKFGWIKLLPTDQVNNLPFFQKLGKEPWDLTDDEWQKLLHTSKKAIKLRLMDQDRIAGLGNIYANDALWLAKIDPRRPASSLTKSEAKTLHQAAIKVLRQGIKYGGATAQDGKYVDLQGLGGHYQDHFKVYQREGQPCLRCSKLSRHSKISRHSEPRLGGAKNPQQSKSQSSNNKTSSRIKRIKQGGRSTFYCPQCQV